MSKMCPICGKPTRSYMGHERNDGLCGHHANLLKAGTIELVDGVYVYSENGKPVECLTKAEDTKEEEEEKKKTRMRKKRMKILKRKRIQDVLFVEHRAILNPFAIPIIHKPKKCL